MDKDMQYRARGVEVINTVIDKQKAYGDSFGNMGKILRVLYPDGIKPEQYDDMLAVTRIQDKIFRIANKKSAFGESPYKDICGYALLGLVKDEKPRREVI